MKTLTKLIGYLGAFGITLLSCTEEEAITATKIQVQFENAAQDILENAEEGVVLLTLSRPAPADATLSLKAGSAYAGVLQTEPSIENGLINIAIAKGDVSAQLRVKPIDNDDQDGDKRVDLTVHNLPPSFTAGVRKSLALMVRDDETGGPQSIANFIDQQAALEETNSTGIEYQIHLSEAVATESQIRISLSSDNGTYGVHYLTEPEAENNFITLTVSPGLRVIGFRVKPVNNEEITGELRVRITISETNGSVAKGDRLEQILTIKDEELAQKPKGYEVTAGNFLVKRFYEYDVHGRIARVRWENYTPFLLQGTDTYYYDASHNIVKINKHAGIDVLYYWDGGRIVKSEEIVHGVVNSYTNYAYDEAGNVGGVVTYHRQENGTYLKGMYTIYLYFSDGNLYKSLTYHDTDDPESPYLISTKTYENYIDVANPFPMTEVLPGIKQQTKLATTYRVEESGVDATYHMMYEYRPDGLPGKRIATATGDTQTAVYHYY